MLSVCSVKDNCKHTRGLINLVFGTAGQQLSILRGHNTPYPFRVSNEGLHAKPTTLPQFRRLWSDSVTYPFETSHTLIVLSRLALTMKASPGKNRAIEIVWSWSYSVLVFLYSFTLSQILMVRSEEHDTAHMSHQGGWNLRDT